MTDDDAKRSPQRLLLFLDKITLLCIIRSGTLTPPCTIKNDPVFTNICFFHKKVLFVELIINSL